ncbi:MAG TPA: hypothetical protein VET48_12070 [Steroidobacteraceae bacterium]|nr:hypothetical protein [Steroidobacteraceae bacterium]
MAPGLYGNCSAQEYFNQTYATFAEATQSSSQSSKPLEEKTGLTANCEEENSSDAQRVEISLTVPFVVTATSLEKGQERYFLFLHHNHSKALGDQAWFNLASDGRWLTVPNYRGCDLRAAAFASGSPFPVFSSHQVALASLNVHEQLIDGGFAHNKPLDAARVLNASKVLVLNSSPLEETIANRNCQWTDWFKWGELSCNVPKLLPYLWSRSQVEDSLSSAQMLVASIYPAGDGDAWPMLTDFRGATVDRMIKAADNDLKRKRIGTIESWGAPRSGDAYLLPVNTVIVQRELAK